MCFKTYSCPNPVDPYQVVFHPVLADARVGYPSHFKRFEVKMFAFAEGEEDLNAKVACKGWKWRFF